MQQCKKCLKYRYSIDEKGLCDSCRPTNQKSVSLNVTAQNVYKSIPYLRDGRIMYKHEWDVMKGKVDSFYDEMSNQEIRDYNKTLKERKSVVVNRETGGYIYLLACSTGHYKIGKAINVEKRVGQHLRSYPVKLEIVHVMRVANMTRCERFLLDLFEEKRLQGEWFSLSRDDVDWIKLLNGESLEKLAETK